MLRRGICNSMKTRYKQGLQYIYWIYGLNIWLHYNSTQTCDALFTKNFLRLLNELLSQNQFRYVGLCSSIKWKKRTVQNRAPELKRLLACIPDDLTIFELFGCLRTKRHSFWASARGIDTSLGRVLRSSSRICTAAQQDRKCSYF